MLDLGLCSVSGARNIGKARVLHHLGTLKAFGKDGQPLFSLDSTAPHRRRGWMRTYDAHTQAGPVHITSALCRCGWRRSSGVSKSPSELWHGE